MPSPKLQCPDIYRGSHLTVFGQCLPGTEPKYLVFRFPRRKISVPRAPVHPLISSPALDGDDALDDVLDGGLDGALHSEHYFAIEGALDGVLDEAFDGDFVGTL